MTKKPRGLLRPFQFSTRDRAVDGVTVTFCNPETGEERTRHVGGFHHQEKVGGRFGPTKVVESCGVLDCLQDAIGISEKWEGRWMVQCISSPQMILTDLIGSRAMTKNAHPELNLLRKIGRLDLCLGVYSKDNKERSRRAEERHNAAHPWYEDDAVAAADGRGSAGGTGVGLAYVFGTGV